MAPSEVVRSTDFIEMCESIVEWVKEYGSSILVKDDAVQRTLGFCTDPSVPGRERTWVIGLTDLKRSFEDDRLEPLRLELGTIECRVWVAYILSSGLLPWEAKLDPILQTLRVD
jgi:hypothetical protein